MDDNTRFPEDPRSDRFGSTGDPAVHALTELLHSELALAVVEEPALLDRVDSGRVWLLWFAIGATEEVCDMVQRVTERERNLVFRQVVGTIFDDGVRSKMNPVEADRRLGYYLEALRVGGGDLR